VQRRVRPQATEQELACVTQEMYREAGEELLPKLAPGEWYCVKVVPWDETEAPAVRQSWETPPRRRVGLRILVNRVNERVDYRVEPADYSGMSLPALSLTAAQELRSRARRALGRIWRGIGGRR
jgi:hypothetical protein